VRGVTNPAPASGGADAESGNQIRRYATAGLISLGRALGVQDYADFALAYGGVGKAHAWTVEDLAGRTVHVVVAGTTTAPLIADSALLQAITTSLVTLSGNPNQGVMVQPCSLYYAVVTAELRLAADHRKDTVEPAVVAALTAAFGYDQRDLGEPLYREDLIRVIQDVSGVSALVLHDVRRIAQSATPSGIQAILAGYPDTEPVGPTDLIVLDPGIPGTLTLTELP